MNQNETIQRNDGSNIKMLYRELAQDKMNDLKQTTKQIAFFKKLYESELLTNKNCSKTLEIIENLEVIYESEKTDYHRLKTISISGIVS